MAEILNVSSAFLSAVENGKKSMPDSWYPILKQNYALTDEDMARIASLDKEQSSFFSHYDPNMVEWFVKMVEERKTRHRSEEEKKAW